MAPAKSRQRQFADLQERLVKDIDPENEALPPSDDESADSDVEKAETKAATDHYVSVGKSKLRAGKTSTASLGPQYRGAKVSRADLEATSEDEDDEDDNFEDAREELASDDSSASGDDVFDDPETADLEADHDGRDVEIDSDDAFGESDEERFKDYTFRGSSKVLPGGKGKRIPRATAADFLGSDEDEEGSEDDEGEGSEDEEGESLGSEEEDSDDEMIDEQRMGLIDDEAEESDEEEEEEDGDLDGFIVDSDEDEEDEDEDGESSGHGNSDDEDDEMDDKADRNSSRKTAGGRDDMASLIATGSKSVTSSLSDGQQKDVAKGTAIRQQRKAFDALLNVRIRLQKSLVAINTLPLAADASTEDEPPYEAAEAAALKLWNAIDSFRSNLPSSGPSKKRKRSAVATAETTSQQIWESIEAAEQRAAPRRRAVLQNWSQKANNIRTVDRSSARNKFSAGPAEKTLVGRLDEEMENPERLVKRTRTPRSCAPAQAARKVNEDAHIYDDADFYQLLLKDLVDQRTADTSAGGGAGAAAAATVRFAAVKEAKAKKHVDTKASKGRKMRFNVHDKLQNFMAPEDRRSWEQSAIDRLFGTLFGQKMALNEDDVSEDEEMDGGVDAEEAGLRLFRS